MCRSDTAVYTAEWVKDSHEPKNKELRSDAEVMSVNWGSLDMWARSRVLNDPTLRYLPGLFEGRKGDRTV